MEYLNVLSVSVVNLLMPEVNMIFITEVYLSFLAQNIVETLDFPLLPSLQAIHSSVKLWLSKVTGKHFMM